MQSTLSPLARGIAISTVIAMCSATAQILPDGSMANGLPTTPTTKINAAANGGGSNQPTQAACGGFLKNMNPANKTSGGQNGNSNVVGVAIKTGAQALLVTGATIRCTSNGAGVRSVELWSTDAAGMPIAKLTEVTGGVKCASSPTVPLDTSGIFAKPQVLKPGTQVALITGIISGAPGWPCMARSVGTPANHYWHPANQPNGPWRGPFPSFAWYMQLDCCTTTKCSPSSYTISGKGCPGSLKGPGGCFSQNLTCTTAFGNGGNTNVFATPFKLKTAAAVDGCILRTAGAGTFLIEIWTADTAGKPTGTGPIASGTMKTAAPFANYTGKFSKPIPLKPGDYCLVRGLTAGSGGISGCARGTGTPSVHYWHPPASHPSGAWNGPFTSLAWAFAITCIGGGGGAPISPKIGNTGVPTVGKSLDITLSKAAPKTGATLFIGLSSTVWGGFKLPLNLGILGAPLCDVRASGDVAIGVATSSTGTGSVKIALANNSFFVGKQFHNQWFVIDPKANNLGIAATELGTGMIGN